MPQHRAMTGASLHEPKGAETASINEVYVADGSQSGSFQLLDFDNLNGISQMPLQADSTATLVAGVVSDLNDLISKLKTAGLMATA